MNCEKDQDIDYITHIHNTNWYYSEIHLLDKHVEHN